MSDPDTESARGELLTRVEHHLARIYPEGDNAAWARRLIDCLELSHAQIPPAPRNKWDETDVLLITYGNSIVREGERPLRTLCDFIEQQLADVVNTVHILPFFPYSSDDGYAVLNYLQVNDALGEWQDIERIGRRFRLMVDLVINHASSRSQWFENFKAGVDPGQDFFVTVAPGTDTSGVVRPRSEPLLQPVMTAAGERLVWCTFGPDQPDLNFANPGVLAEMTTIIARYLEAGARMLRLSGVAFLWKQAGTGCIHLPQTHELVKLLRTLAEFKCLDAMLVTDTDVPNRDNLTYLGKGDEAHAIYNFSLPPLLIQTLLSGDCRHLKTWMMSMPPAREGTCYLNFIACHDGIGLRPAEGLLTEGELQRLLDTLTRFGGHVSMRRDETGALRPNEANISLWSALKGTIDIGPDRYQFERFICAHAIMFALEGVPAVYLQSLFGTPNDTALVERSGRYRSINRPVWDADHLASQLADPAHHAGRVLARMKHLMAVRRRQPAFHPNAVQFTMHLDLSLFAFWRQSADRRQSIFCIANITDAPQIVELADVNLIGTERWGDLISGKTIAKLDARVMLRPYQTLWLSNCDGALPFAGPDAATS